MMPKGGAMIRIAARKTLRRCGGFGEVESERGHLARLYFYSLFLQCIIIAMLRHVKNYLVGRSLL